MFIFLVDFWLPFPSSEYGGLQCIIAQDEDEVIKILVDLESDYYKESYEDCEDLIVKCVRKSLRYKLDSKIRYNKGIVREFIT